MFNNDVTKNYTQQDATLEILIMLAGAFLLGCLLCWLIRKLMGENKQAHSLASSSHNSHNNESRHISETSSTATLKPQSLVNKDASKKTMPANYSTPRIDDLTKISGIDTEIETGLRKRGIKSYIDLRDTEKQSILDTIGESTGGNITTREAQTWPHQASLAAKGEWEKLNEYQAFMLRTKQEADNIKQQTKPDEANDPKVSHFKSTVNGNHNKNDIQLSDEHKQDDLKKIEGIGPKIEEVLNGNSILTFRDLRKSDRDTLKGHLDNAGNRFKMHEPESWPHQAGMAERGEWEELKIYQEFMDGGREIPSESASSQIDSAGTSKANDKESEKPQSDNNIKISQDDLKKIEGIGPKIEEILKSEGITTFAKLHLTDRDTLKGYLDKAGNQFKMHEPESWPHQAGMAATGQWEELKIYQDFMDGGREVPSGSVSSKLSDSKPSLHVNNTIKDEADDFKKIEGIGPKIQELLNNSGIKTYKDLLDSDSDSIKKLLDAAGPQYRMHDPETWPKQAKMAFEDEWEKLEDFQKEIIDKHSKK